jgi:hypothetical protein
MNVEKEVRCTSGPYIYWSWREVEPKDSTHP